MATGCSCLDICKVVPVTAGCAGVAPQAVHAWRLYTMKETNKPRKEETMGEKTYLELAEIIGGQKKTIMGFEAIPCDSERCVFAPQGYCLVPFLRHGKLPVVTEDGCFQAVDRDLTGGAL